MSSPKFWAVLSSQAAFSWRNSVQKILSKWLLKRLVRHIILSQKCFKLRNDDIEDNEVENRLEKKEILPTAVWKMSSHLPAFLLAANFVSDQWRQKNMAAKTVSKWRPPKSIIQDEFFKIGSRAPQRLKPRWVEKLNVYLLWWKPKNKAFWSELL